MPRLNSRALTIGTYTSSYPPVAEVIAAATGLEAMGCGDRRCATARSGGRSWRPSSRSSPS